MFEKRLWGLSKLSPNKNIIAGLFFLVNFGPANSHDVIERYQDFKGITVQVTRPVGFQSVRSNSENNVFQWLRQKEPDVIFGLQLAVYMVPVDLVNEFQKLDPVDWGRRVVPPGAGEIISITRGGNELRYSIDIIYDHTLVISPERWRSRSLMRAFVYNQRVISTECVASTKINPRLPIPSREVMENLYNQQVGYCNTMLDSLKIF